MLNFNTFLTGVITEVFIMVLLALKPSLSQLSFQGAAT